MRLLRFWLRYCERIMDFFSVSNTMKNIWKFWLRVFPYFPCVFPAWVFSKCPNSSLVRYFHKCKAETKKYVFSREWGWEFASWSLKWSLNQIKSWEKIHFLLYTNQCTKTSFCTHNISFLPSIEHFCWIEGILEGRIPVFCFLLPRPKEIPTQPPHVLEESYPFNYVARPDRP